MGRGKRRGVTISVWVLLTAIGCRGASFDPTAKNRFPFEGKEAWILQTENVDGTAGNNLGLFFADYSDSCTMLKQAKFVRGGTVLTLSLLDVGDTDGTLNWENAPVAQGTFPIQPSLFDQEPTQGAKAALGTFYKYNDQCAADGSSDLSAGQVQIRSAKISAAAAIAGGHVSANVAGDDRLLDFDFEATSCRIKLAEGIPSCVDPVR